MTNTGFETDCMIVGAGMAGLMAAEILLRRNVGVRLIDKGRGVGGRLATRRVGPGRADHGAQFFTVRTSEFESRVAQWQAEGLVYRWSSGWSDGSLAAADPDGHPRYAVRGGMNALAKHLAHGLTVHADSRLVSLDATDGGWLAHDEKGVGYAARALILTPPVPQSLALLEASRVQLSPDDRAALERIVYAPCLAAMFWVDGAVDLPEPGALQRPEADVGWIADNRRKGISPDASVITLHAGPAYSRQLWDATDIDVLEALRGALKPFLDADTEIVEEQLKRWRYALPTTLHPERYLVAAGLPTCAFAGDAFGWPRIEGAALSGIAAAKAIADSLGQLSPAE